MKPALLTLVLLAVVLGFGGCKNSSSSTPSASATPTTAPTPSPAPTGPATPTPVPTASPIPTPSPQSYQPLASGDVWSYACNNGTSVTKTAIATPPPASSNGIPTFADMTALSSGSLTAIEGNDAVGNTLVFGWTLGTTTTAVNPFGLEFPINPPLGQTTTFPGPGTNNTVTVTYMGPQAAVTTPAGTFTNVVLFAVTMTNPPSPAFGSQQEYMVKGVGAVVLQFPQSAPALTCSLQSFTLF